ncbi:MAG: HDIG domain-containing metalloprotein [Cyanobacteria bacterium P01_F01_bin.3]
MSVLRNIASWVRSMWAQSFLWLRSPGRHRQRVEQQVGYRTQSWLDHIRQLLLLDHGPGALAPNQVRHTGQVRKVRKAYSNGHVRMLSSKGSHQAWTATLLAVLLLATCFGQRFYRQPGLDVRSVSPQTFYAPASAVVEDKKATENRRENVRNGAEQVLKIDIEQTAAAERSLKTLLTQGRELRSQAGRPNFLNLDTLSRPTQDYLFRSTEAEWDTLWRLAKTNSLTTAYLIADDRATSNAPASRPRPTQTEGGSPDAAADTPAEPLPAEVVARIKKLSPIQKDVLQELLAYRELTNIPRLTQLQTRVKTRRQQYLQAYEDFIEAASTKDQPLYNYRLFELSEAEWIALESNAKQIFNEMMLQGISVGMPDDLLRRAIEARVPVEPSPAVRQLTADVLEASVMPNLVQDEERTWQLAEQAVRQIDPVMVSVNQGELIVREDEVITSSDFALLDHFDLTDRYFNWIGLSGFTLLIGCAAAFYLWVDNRQMNQLNQRDHCLVILLCLVVSILAALRVPSVGLPAVGLLVGSFYGSALGMTVVGLLALVLPIGLKVSTIPLISGCAAALLGTWIAPQLRSREEYALLGGFVGLSQASVHLVLTLMRSTVGAPLWQAVFVGSALNGLYGIAWSVVALGVSPYLEHFFDVVTPIRLAELANPNRPLLKRLAAEAPGTFQHTMFVANLAEAAARALGRNVELVRAGTLYHDIGKMHRPEGFIENQMGGPNLHDELDDPWESASIIKKHVTQGLVMARKYRLPLAIQAFIPEHQGDMKIGYFYQQAKARQEKEPSLVVNAADFSYDGPIPQSPETGITMLADSCEAALRSLKPDASMDEAYAMVNKILRARWRCRQLIDSGLSRDDMDIIASVFIQVWQQHNHKRIEYPKNAVAEQEA